MTDRHVFAAKLVVDRSGMGHVDVPAAVSKAIGRGKAPGKRDVPIPPDLRQALVDADVLDAWEAMPPGKREHILGWVEKAVHEVTREKRIARAVEEALKMHERKVDRGR